jgi:hypothetical protein
MLGAMLTGCDLGAGAELLGVSCREYVAIGRRDRRIFPSLASAGAVTRLRRWIAAGQPDADVSRLEFAGDDSVRALVADVLRQVPAPVGWHGVEYVTPWIEVGRSAVGWAGSAPTIRTPDGDQAHMIALAGSIADDGEIRAVIAHELGHSWARTVRPYVSTAVRMSYRERNARSIVAAKIAGVSPTQIVREQVDEERLADALSQLWGFPHYSDYGRRERGFSEEMQEAAELATKIEVELEEGAKS